MQENTANLQQLNATDAGPRPGDFPVGSLESRAAMRTRLLGIHSRRERHLLVVETIGMPLDLASSECFRRRDADGAEWVVALLNGKREDVAEHDLESWINSFPITAS